MAITKDQIAEKLTALGVEVASGATKDDMIEAIMSANLTVKPKPAVAIAVDPSIRDALKARAKKAKTSMRDQADALLREALASAD